MPADLPGELRAHDAATVQATCCATLVDQWVRDGVRHAVVAPGSRSTPMALAIAARPELRVDVMHDERAAAFAALGAGLATGMPSLVLCTSGTAATHLHAAVVEAHLAHVPLLVLTADRPPELRDVGAPQTIDQTKLFGGAVRWFHDPGVPAAEAAAAWRSTARHALAAAVGPDAGPVHLNLPFREPLVGEPAPLPPPRLGAWSAGTGAVEVEPLDRGLAADLRTALVAGRGLVVAGRGVDDPAAVADLATATGWPVLADPRSGCRGLPGVVAAFDPILRHGGFAAAHRPEAVVHLGEPPASKVLGTWLADVAVQVRVTATRGVVDPAHTVTHRVVAPPSAVCRALARLRWPVADGWAAGWARAAELADAALTRACGADAPALDEPAVARFLGRRPGHLVVASSMPVRDLEWFGPAEQRATAWSNRGANGIDGTVATAVGVAAATGEPVTVLLGDIALLHDSSALVALAHRDLTVRIVVVDNDGGGIFSFLPQAAALSTSRFEQLFGTPHGTDLESLAAAHHLPASRATSEAELDRELDAPGSRLVRVVSERSANVARHAALHAAVARALDGA